MNITIVFIIYRVIPSYIINPGSSKDILLCLGFRHDDISHSIIQIISIVVIFASNVSCFTFETD